MFPLSVSLRGRLMEGGVESGVGGAGESDEGAARREGMEVEVMELRG